MVRTAITIISLLLSVVMPSLASAQNINVTGTQKKGDDYILYVKDIPLPNSVKIYGQPTFKSNDEYYGGKFFNESYAAVNNSVPGLEFDRNENGIFFKIPATSDIDIVYITLIQAHYTEVNGWCPNGPNDNIYVVWRLKDKSCNLDKLIERVDSIENVLSGGQPKTEVLSSWQISNIDLVLFVIIVILALAALFGKSKPKEELGDKSKAAEDTKFEIEELKKQITNLTTACNNCIKAISDLGCRCNTLESDVHKLKEKGRQVNTGNSSKNIQALRPLPPAKPVNLGSAEPVAGEKELEINNSGAAFFQLTGNADGQVTFTLIDNTEVRNLFETNPSMLEIYKNDGIISYDSIPNNSHVYVESTGIVKETRPGKYEVLAPLKLIFK